MAGGGGIDLRSPSAILGRLAGNTLARYRGHHLDRSARTHVALFFEERVGSNMMFFDSGGSIRRQVVLWGLMESHKTPLTPLY